jgi:hypothetical protein
MDLIICPLVSLKNYLPSQAFNDWSCKKIFHGSVQFSSWLISEKTKERGYHGDINSLVLRTSRVQISDMEQLGKHLHQVHIRLYKY